MSSYRHGVYVREEASSIVAPVAVDGAMPVVVGTAPVQTLELAPGKQAPVNEPKLIYSWAEFVAAFGSVPEGASYADYTLSETARIFLTRYNVAPLVAINVFDPTRHVDDSGAPDVSKVTADDIIGGIDSATHKKSGLELVSSVFSHFRLTPGFIMAPRFSADPKVALTIGAKCLNINGHFRAMGIIDIPDEVAYYTDAPAWLNDNNLTDCNLVAMFGSLLYGDAESGEVEPGSAHVAGLAALSDSGNFGIPFMSPSNQRFEANGAYHAGEGLFLDAEEANYLNGQGIVTALNFQGGLKMWGNRTAAYPGITDEKDAFIPVRRMFNYLNNTVVLNCWQFVDRALMRARTRDTVVDSLNQWFNSMVARECILGGRVEFSEADNSKVDLMDGIARFRIHYTPPPPGRLLEFTAQLDLEYLRTIFGA